MKINNLYKFKKMNLKGRRKKEDSFGRNWWMLFNEWVQSKRWLPWYETNIRAIVAKNIDFYFQDVF